jgi:hypothetical protein
LTSESVAEGSRLTHSGSGREGNLKEGQRVSVTTQRILKGSNNLECSASLKCESASEGKKIQEGRHDRANGRVIRERRRTLQGVVTPGRGGATQGAYGAKP